MGGKVGSGGFGPRFLQMQPALSPTPAARREQPAQYLTQPFRSSLGHIAANSHNNPRGQANGRRQPAGESLYQPADAGRSPGSYVSGMTKYEYSAPQRYKAGLPASIRSSVSSASCGNTLSMSTRYAGLKPISSVLPSYSIGSSTFDRPAVAPWAFSVRLFLLKRKVTRLLSSSVMMAACRTAA